MRPTVYIQDLKNHVGEEVNLKGWLYNKRSSGKIKFIVLRDSSNIIQCVIEKNKVTEKEWEDIQKVLVESSIEIGGDIKKDKEILDKIK